MMVETVMATAEGPLPVLTSDVLPGGFVHGFSTRLGGGPRGAAGGFDGRVPAHRRRLQEASGAARLFVAHQVHGAHVIDVGLDDDPARIAAVKADGLSSCAAGAAVAVLAADCVPVLLADPRTGAVAAVHAGWRGTAAKVVVAALARMTRIYGTRPADVRAALGPSLGPCCFEVGPEVVSAVLAAAPGAREAGAIVDRAPRPHVDLRRVNQVLLHAAGVPAAAIDPGGACTRCDAARFYSYRRDHGIVGLQAGFIARIV